MPLVHVSRRLAFLISTTLALALAPGVARGQGQPQGPGQGATRPPASAAAPPLDPVKKAEAKKLFDEGADLYAQGSYEKAIAAWEKAFEISGHPLIFESVANAQERLGRPREAKVSLLRWRQAAPVDEHALLDRRLANLDARIAKLAEQEAAEAARGAPPEPGPSPGGEERPGDRGSVGDPPGSPLVPIGFIAAGVGIGAIAGGLVVGGIAAGKRPDEATACRAGDAGSLCLAAQRDAIESSASLALVSDILWIGGAAATAAGVVLVLVGSSESTSSDAASSGGVPSPSRRRERTRAALVPSIGPAGGGATLRGTW